MGPTDWQKLKGCILKWQNSKVILACALFHDLLHPEASLSKVLQENELCVVHAIEVIMKTKKVLDKIKSSPFEELLTEKKVLARIKEEYGLVTYKGQELKRHEEGLTYLKAYNLQWIEAVESCLQNHVKRGEVEILSHAIRVTHGWERTSTPSFAVCQQLTMLLESAGVDLSQVWDEDG